MAEKLLLLNRIVVVVVATHAAAAAVDRDVHDRHCDHYCDRLCHDHHSCHLHLGHHYHRYHHRPHLLRGDDGGNDVLSPHDATMNDGDGVAVMRRRHYDGDDVVHLNVANDDPFHHRYYSADYNYCLCILLDVLRDVNCNLHRRRDGHPHRVDHDVRRHHRHWFVTTLGYYYLHLRIIASYCRSWTTVVFVIVVAAAIDGVMTRCHQCRLAAAK